MIGVGHLNPHLHNNGATSTSTETTASGVKNEYATTTTTDATQMSTGNGHIVPNPTTTTDTTATFHPVTNTIHNYPPPSPSPPPPTVYVSAPPVKIASQHFQKVVGPGHDNPHAINNGASSTSTETTATGAVNNYLETTTTDATQVNTGNGHVVSQTTTTTTDTIGHPVTNTIINDFTSTSDMPPDDTPILPGTPVCDSSALLVQLNTQNMCLHVMGALSNGVFNVKSTLLRPVVTMWCSPTSPNQRFTWVPRAQGGQLVHIASNLALSLNITAPVKNNARVGVLSINTGTSQKWVWENPTTGGVIRSAVNQNFEVTNAKKRGKPTVALPVKMWHLNKTMPSGGPTGQWQSNCVA
jgi:hypothetical protein